MKRAPRIESTPDGAKLYAVNGLGERRELHVGSPLRRTDRIEIALFNTDGLQSGHFTCHIATNPEEPPTSC